MLRVQAILRPRVAEALCHDLLAWGSVTELGVSEVTGAGRRYEGSGKSYVVDTLPKVLIECFIDDVHRDEIIDRICSRCRSGHRGDGKIFITKLSE